MKSRNSKREQSPRTELPADESLSNMESIAELENEMEDDGNHEEMEQMERNYSGRSTEEEDGAIPMEPPRVDPLRSRSLQRPTAPPKHNM